MVGKGLKVLVTYLFQEGGSVSNLEILISTLDNTLIKKNSRKKDLINLFLQKLEMCCYLGKWGA